jgi:hypothetical protein
MMMMMMVVVVVMAAAALRMVSEAARRGTNMQHAQQSQLPCRHLCDLSYCHYDHYFCCCTKFRCNLQLDGSHCAFWWAIFVGLAFDSTQRANDNNLQLAGGRTRKREREPSSRFRSFLGNASCAVPIKQRSMCKLAFSIVWTERARERHHTANIV